MAAFAQLTEAERERLEMLAEEAAEIVKCCTKILRHGYHSYNPNLPGHSRISNKNHLEKELMELWTVYERMAAEGELDRINFIGTVQMWKAKMKYTHHQPPFHHPLDGEKRG